MPTLPDRSSRSADLEALLDVARRLGAAVDLDGLLAAVAAAATGVLDCERATVFLHDHVAGELHSRVATGISDSPLGEIRFPVTQGIAGEVARTGTTVNLPDAYADPRFNAAIDRSSGFRTRNMLAVRLVGHDGTSVGVLQLLNKRSGPFASRDEEVATFLAGQAGVAIERQTLIDHLVDKRRIERDLSIARDIQQGLLPRDIPTVPGFGIAGWNRPAAETGGDFYDVLPLADGRVAFAIADVTGHGIGPALVMAEARALFRAAVRQSGDLERTVTEMHDLLCLDLAPGRFVTACCGILSPGDGTIDYLSAGQGPILYWDASTSAIRTLDAQGPPLGFIPEFAYGGTETVRLGPGDAVVLVTDGFFEWARGDGTAFGIPRVEEIVRHHGSGPPAALIAALTAAVEAFAAGAPQEDDLTALVVARDASAG